MAEIKEGILGGVHGKVGPVVGFMWRGRYFLRSKPRTSSKEATPLQRFQRDKMGLVSTFASKIKNFVNAHYPLAMLNDKMATGKEQLISMLMNEGILIIDGVPCIDVSAVLLSIGSLPPAVIKKIAKLKTGRIKVLWDNSITNILTKNTDRLTMVAYNETTYTFVEIESIGKREDKFVHFDLPDEWNAGNVHFWSVWKSADGKLISTSAYHGKMVLNEETDKDIASSENAYIAVEKEDVVSDIEQVEPVVAEIAISEMEHSIREDSQAERKGNAVEKDKLQAENGIDYDSHIKGSELESLEHVRIEGKKETNREERKRKEDKMSVKLPENGASDKHPLENSKEGSRLLLDKEGYVGRSILEVLRDNEEQDEGVD